MKIIKEIIEHIDEEMEGVCEYIKFASKTKSENEYVFDTLMTIIPQEIKHIEMLHDVAVKEINKSREDLRMKGKEIPAYMFEMWQDEHEKYIEELSKIKYKVEMLKSI
jgi:hypothetical protein